MEGIIGFNFRRDIFWRPRSKMLDFRLEVLPEMFLECMGYG
jgi:hypothetical protein